MKRDDPFLILFDRIPVPWGAKVTARPFFGISAICMGNAHKYGSEDFVRFGITHRRQYTRRVANQNRLLIRTKLLQKWKPVPRSCKVGIGKFGGYYFDAKFFKSALNIWKPVFRCLSSAIAGNKDGFHVVAMPSSILTDRSMYSSVLNR